VAEQLRSEDVPLSDLLSEMIAASSIVHDEVGVPTGGDRVIPDAVAELLSEPMTAAESVGTLVLATTAARARDAQVDDEDLLRVMALAAVLAARFETYLAERSSAPAS